MRPHYVSHAPFTEMGFGCQCVSQRGLKFSIAGSPLCQGWLLKGLSRVMGNYHARFLGGLGLATAPGYPVYQESKQIPSYFIAITSPINLN